MVQAIMTGSRGGSWKRWLITLGPRSGVREGWMLGLADLLLFVQTGILVHAIGWCCPHLGSNFPPLNFSGNSLTDSLEAFLLGDSNPIELWKLSITTTPRLGLLLWPVHPRATIGLYLLLTLCNKSMTSILGLLMEWPLVKPSEQKVLSNQVTNAIFHHFFPTSLVFIKEFFIFHFW